MQLVDPACADAAVPVLPYPFVALHDEQLLAPASLYLLSPHTGHVLPDLYAPATQVPTLHRPVTLLFEESHVCVPHVERFAIAVHAVEQVLSALVLNAVPVPDVVLPAGHAVQLLAPAELYEPVAHAVPVYAVVPPSLL